MMVDVSKLAIVDQIAMVLRGHPFPMVSVQIAKECPPVLRQTPCTPDRHDSRFLRGPEYVVEECHGDHHCIARDRTSAELNPILTKMEADGLLERIEPQGSKAHFWRWVGSELVDLSQFEFETKEQGEDWR